LLGDPTGQLQLLPDLPLGDRAPWDQYRRLHPAGGRLPAPAHETHPRAGPPTPVTNTTADAAVAAGFLLIVPNTRTGDGYYVDSDYTGPQAQDILDAIAHEESIRHIGKLYLFGFSMGSMGAISIGLNHPGMFAGIGAVAAFSDDFELEARLVVSANQVLES